MGKVEDGSSTPLTRLRRIRGARCGTYGRASSDQCDNAPVRSSRRPRCGPASRLRHPRCALAIVRSSQGVAPRCPHADRLAQAASALTICPVRCHGRWQDVAQKNAFSPSTLVTVSGRSPPRTQAGYGLVKRWFRPSIASNKNADLGDLFSIIGGFSGFFACGNRRSVLFFSCGQGMVPTTKPVFAVFS